MKQINGKWFHNGKEIPSWVRFFRVWGSRGEGRFWKRKLSKARRRAWKNPGHERGLPGIESTCNRKNW